MTTNNITVRSTAKNKGIAAQQNYEFTMTGRMNNHDSRRWFAGSDVTICGVGISIKADGFSLADARTNMGETFDEKWSDYESRVHSTKFVYITAENIAYEMNIAEFKKFVYTFCYLSRESSKNGGGCKIRCKHESQKMRDWLARMAA